MGPLPSTAQTCCGHACDYDLKLTKVKAVGSSTGLLIAWQGTAIMCHCKSHTAMTVCMLVMPTYVTSTA